MSDLIERRAAIDALCAVCGKSCDKSEFVYNAPQDEQVILCPEYYALCTLPSSQTEQRWVPRSERMPEKPGEYLCCWQGKAVSVGMFLNGHFRLFGENKDKLVTAWMPLPEPYMGGGEQE